LLLLLLLLCLPLLLLLLLPGGGGVIITRATTRTESYLQAVAGITQSEHPSNRIGRLPHSM
jgi:hypothetical protein